CCLASVMGGCRVYDAWRAVVGVDLHFRRQVCGEVRSVEVMRCELVLGVEEEQPGLVVGQRRERRRRTDAVLLEGRAVVPGVVVNVGPAGSRDRLPGLVVELGAADAAELLDLVPPT